MSRATNKSFIRTQPDSFVYIFSMAAFVLQLQSWAVVTETGWSAKSKICAIWVFIAKSLLIPVLWHSGAIWASEFFLWNSEKKFFFFRKNSKAILLWKKFDSLGWFEMRPLGYDSSAYSVQLESLPPLTHLLNTLELSPDGKARSYYPNCPSIIHLDCVMGLVSQTLWVHPSFLNHL